MNKIKKNRERLNGQFHFLEERWRKCKIKFTRSMQRQKYIHRRKDCRKYRDMTVVNDDVVTVAEEKNNGNQKPDGKKR